MPTVTIEADIFSGRPNPQWSLSEADAAAYVSRMAELEQTTPTAGSGALGYRGLIVSVSSAPSGAVHVHNGVVEVRDARSSAFFLDPHRSLERWLFARRPPGLSGDVVKAIETDLEK